MPVGISGLTLSDLAQTYIRLISTAIIYAWIYNSTNGSLLLVMVAHAGHNIGTELIPAGDSQAVPVIVALLYLVVACGRADGGTPDALPLCGRASTPNAKGLVGSPTPVDVGEDLFRGVTSGRAEDRPAGPGAGAAEVEVLYRCAIARVAGDGAALEHLLG